VRNPVGGLSEETAMDLERRLRQSGREVRQTDVTAPSGGLAHLARRRAAVRRRRVAAVGVAAALVLVAGVVTVSLLHDADRGVQRAGSGEGVAPASPSPNAAVAEVRSRVERAALSANAPVVQKVAGIEQDFTFALLRQLTASSPGTNVVASPSSIATALSMLELGAAGPTEQQIATALQSTSLTPDEQAEGWNALTADLAAAAAHDEIELSTANDTWMEKTFPIKNGYLDSLARNFGVGVYRTDFVDQPDTARQAINAKVADETHQKIKDLIPDGVIDRATRLVLTNAVYFKAAWADAFAASDTSDGTFHAASGDTTVPFMHNDELQTKAMASPDVDAVELPFVGGRFAALIVEPKSMPLDEYVAQLDRTGLTELLAHMRRKAVGLAMPRFEANVAVSLKRTLQAMGMKVPFTGAADFSPISDTPTEVAAVQHQAYLKVTEAGTEAAAATAVVNRAVSAIMPAVRITIDRPFLFLVRDTQTGTILFAAAVQNP
jgi:serpin B